MDNGKAVSNGKLGRLRLTKSEVDKLSGPESGYINYMDEHMPGFGVRVTAAGVKTYFLERRVRGSKRRISIGRAGDISAEFARKQAKVLAGQIAAGMDPVAERTRHKLETIKLEQALGHYIKEKDLKPRTISDMEKAFEESFSDWQKKELTKITRAMVKARYLQRVEKSKARANVAFRYLRAVYNWAIAEFRDAEERPILKDNPVSFLSEQKLWHQVSLRSRDALWDIPVPKTHSIFDSH